MSNHYLEPKDFQGTGLVCGNRVVWVGAGSPPAAYNQLVNMGAYGGIIDASKDMGWKETDITPGLYIYKCQDGWIAAPAKALKDTTKGKKTLKKWWAKNQ